MALTPGPWMASSFLCSMSPKVGASGIHSKITCIFLFFWILLFYFGFHGKEENNENTLREIRIHESLLCTLSQNKAGCREVLPGGQQCCLLCKLENSSAVTPRFFQLGDVEIHVLNSWVLLQCAQKFSFPQKKLASTIRQDEIP